MTLNDTPNEMNDTPMNVTPSAIGYNSSLTYVVQGGEDP